ncbi:MAG: Crp/Fnr family transcriptional regulator [Chitinophagaceae bacterium]
MEDVRPFFEYLHKFIPLSWDEFTNDIYPYITIRSFGKKELINKAGEVENYLNFILTGLIRKYYKKGHEEVVTQISVEGQITHAHESFHGRQPSDYYMEAIEPTTLASITYDDLELIYSRSAKMERLGRLVTIFAMLSRDKWHMDMIKLTPRERFLKFVERNPDLIQRVPQKQLASYLNIQPETFSRFKHLLRRKR